MQLIIALIIIGGLVYAAYKTVSYTHRNINVYFQTDGLLLLSRAALVIVGCIVGLVFAWLKWRWSTNQVIIGFPVPAAVWEYVNGHWEDFVSPLSLPLMAVNFIIGLGVAHVPIACAFIVRKRKAKRLAKDAA